MVAINKNALNRLWHCRFAIKAMETLMATPAEKRYEKIPYELILLVDDCAENEWSLIKLEHFCLSDYHGKLYRGEKKIKMYERKRNENYWKFRCNSHWVLHEQHRKKNTNTHIHATLEQCGKEIMMMIPSNFHVLTQTLYTSIHELMKCGNCVMT